MATNVKYILAFTLSFGLTTVLAQKPKTETNTKPTTFQKYTPPKLISMLGIRTDTAYIYMEEALQLVTLPLRVTDDKKNAYTISSYMVVYKRRAVTEDEASGKVSPIISNVSGRFKATPLSPIWIKSLTEQLRVGEELHFLDIVAKDAQGRLMFAPELRIIVKK